MDGGRSSAALMLTKRSNARKACPEPGHAERREATRRDQAIWAKDFGPEALATHGEHNFSRVFIGFHGAVGVGHLLPGQYAIDDGLDFLRFEEGPGQAL